MLDTLRKKIYKALRRSEKYAQTDMVYLAKGGSWASLNRVINSVAGFLLAIAFANLLPKDAYGTYKYIFSIMGVLFVTTLPRFNTALKRAVAQGYEGSAIPILKMRMKGGTVGAIVALGIAGYYLVAGNMLLAAAFLIAATFLPFMYPLGIYGPILEGRKDFKTSSIYGITLELANTIPMIIVMFFTGNVLLIVLTFFASYTLTEIFLLRRIYKKINLNTKVADDTINYGKHLTVMDIIGSVAGQLDKILMWHFLGAAALATYSFAIAPVDQSKRLLKTVNSLAFPKLATKPPRVLKNTLPKKVFKYLGITILIALTYIIAAPYIFQLLFPQYMDSVFYSRIYAIGFIFAPLSIFGTVQSAHANKKALYITKIASPLSKIIALVVLVPILGALGAIIALMTGSLVSVLISYYYFHYSSL